MFTFTAKAGEHPKPAKRDYTRRTPGKFEGDPTYKSKYILYVPNSQQSSMYAC